VFLFHVKQFDIMVFSGTEYKIWPAFIFSTLPRSIVIM
jgi:hypothetical protein